MVIWNQRFFSCFKAKILFFILYSSSARVSGEKNRHESAITGGTTTFAVVKPTISVKNIMTANIQDHKVHSSTKKQRFLDEKTFESNDILHKNAGGGYKQTRKLEQNGDDQVDDNNGADDCYGADDYYGAGNDANKQGDDGNVNDVDDAVVNNVDDYYYKFYNYEGNQEYLFNVIDFSLKYIRCQSIQTYSDDLAEDEDSDSVLRTDSFVAIRLCRSLYCSDGNDLGCDDDYGEFLIQLDEYLEIMEPYIEDRNDAFCDYCDECLNNKDRRSRNLENAIDDNSGENEDDDFVPCEYYDKCINNYNAICEEENNNADDGNQIDYSEYLECKKFEQNGHKMYIGPRCSSDGEAIVVGLYYDEDCLQYAGYDYDITALTGLYFEDDGLAEYFPKDCISCRESELKYQEIVEYDDGDNSMSEICENLYAGSSLCNDHVRTQYDNEESTQSYMKAYDKTSCTFIDSVMSGQYNERGEIIVSVREYDRRRGPHNHKISEEMVTEDQIVVLAVLALVCLSLSMYAGVIHRELMDTLKSVRGVQQIVMSHPSLEEDNFVPSFDDYSDCSYNFT